MVTPMRERMESKMTFPLIRNVVCSVCGTEVETHGLASTNTFGSMDLDTRPPEMMRSTMRMWIQSCPTCGYVAGDLADPCPVPKEFLESDAYRSFVDDAPKLALCANFLKKARIAEQAENYAAAEDDYLCAAWCADDGEDAYWSTEARLLTLSMIEKSGSDADENVSALKADLLRKTGQFERLIAEYESKRFSEDILTKIVAFQIAKAKERDMKTYTVDDALGALL